MRRLPISLLLIIMLSTPLAVCAQVYKWTDAHGTVHYADSPPPHGTRYKDIRIAGATAMPEPPASKNEPAQPHDNAAALNDNASAERMQDTPANRKKLCDNLGGNLKLLAQDRPVFIKGAGGKNQPLSKDRRARELAKTQKQYRTYCQ